MYVSHESQACDRLLFPTKTDFPPAASGWFFADRVLNQSPLDEIIGDGVSNQETSRVAMTPEDDIPRRLDPSGFLAKEFARPSTEGAKRP